MHDLGLGTPMDRKPASRENTISSALPSAGSLPQHPVVQISQRISTVGLPLHQRDVQAESVFLPQGQEF